MYSTKKYLFRYRNKNHRDFIKVLDRYQLGIRDGYNRGIWLYESDMAALKAAMLSDPHHYMVDGTTASLCVEGGKPSRHVFYMDFEDALE